MPHFTGSTGQILSFTIKQLNENHLQQYNMTGIKSVIQLYLNSRTQILLTGLKHRKEMEQLQDHQGARGKKQTSIILKLCLVPCSTRYRQTSTTQKQRQQTHNYIHFSSRK